MSSGAATNPGRTSVDPPVEGSTQGFFPRCANPRCATGWLQLWRSRRVPAFEDRWACSPLCMQELVRGGLRRERGSVDPVSDHKHSIPLGLRLLERGLVSREALALGLKDQSSCRPGGIRPRLGECLVARGLLAEAELSRALSAQWGCPVLRVDGFRAAETAASMPLLLAEGCGALPLRLAGRSLQIAFGARVDRSLCYAVERISGQQVVAGIAAEADLAAGIAEWAAADRPRTRIIEAAGEPALARALTRLIESVRPANARLARVHGWYWLRMWYAAPREAALPLTDSVEDVLCSPGPIGANQD